MSDLLNQASLVMIPSGYKEDTVYSVVPSDGSGDLSFTRASNGTRINSAGLVEVCPWNLFEQSNAFSTSPWTLTNGTLTSGQSGYDGLANAWKYTEGTFTASLPVLTQSFSTSTSVETYSFYAKGGTKSWIIVSIGLAGYTWVNITTGVVGGTGGSNPPTITTQLVGNGWYFVQCVNQIVAKDSFTIHITDANNSVSYNGNGTGFVYVQNAQRNIGSTAKPYFPTTDRLNVPRLTYQNGGGGCPSLLLEKQSTNLIEYSNCISAFAFAGTFTASATTSPEGVSNAFSFLVNAGQNGGLSFITLTTSAQSYTFSAYLKGSVNGQKVKLYGDLNGTIEEFTLTTDWVRYTKTFTGSVGAQSLYLLNGSYFTPSQNNLYYGYGFQLEVSSYATSLIPSNGASATRVADACSKTGISSLLGQTEGTIFIDVENNETEGACIISTNAGTGSGSHIYIGQNNNNLALYIRDSFTYSVLESNIANIIGRKKIALAYGASFARIYMNGTQIYNSTSAVIPSGLDRIEMNNFVSTDIGSVKFNEVVEVPYNQIFYAH